MLCEKYIGVFDKYQSLSNTQILILPSVIVACAIALHRNLDGHTCRMMTELENLNLDTVMIGSDLIFYIFERQYTSLCEKAVRYNRQV